MPSNLTVSASVALARMGFGRDAPVPVGLASASWVFVAARNECVDGLPEPSLALRQPRIGLGQPVYAAPVLDA